MDFFELVKARRSVRAYQPQPVEEDKLEQILEAANRAPSAGNLQAYVILVVRHDATKQALVRAALGQEFVAQAPVVLAFFAHRLMSASKYKQRGAELYSVQDATVACTYAQLAATALGLGSVWLGAFNDDEVSRILKAKPDWRPVALLPLGYPAESPEPTPRRPLEELAKDANHG